MTIREIWVGTLAWVDTFVSTMTTQNIVDWPISYFFLIAFFGFASLILAFAAFALISPVISTILYPIGVLLTAAGSWVDFKEGDGVVGAVASAAKCFVVFHIALTVILAVVFILMGEPVTFVGSVVLLISNTFFSAIVSVFCLISNLLWLRSERKKQFKVVADDD